MNPQHERDVPTTRSGTACPICGRTRLKFEPPDEDLDLPDDDHCPACHMPEPADWCWAGDFYCPLSKPPRNLDVLACWREIRKLAGRDAT
jgi:hypothetical protein